MRGRLPRPTAATLSVVTLLAAGGCASHRNPPYPTLEDYSDGVSVFADALFDDWKAGAKNPDLFAPDFAWMGPLPGDDLEKSATRAALEVETYSRPAAKAGGLAERRSGGEEVRLRLAEIRRSFASLGRTESVVLDLRRHRERREAVLALLLTGVGPAGEKRQEGGRIRVELVPGAGTGRARWRLASARLEAWIRASASAPLFEEVAERAGLASVHKAFFSTAARTAPIPGEHLPPGVAVLDYDGDGRDDLFVAGGDGNHLYRNRGDGTFEDVAKTAGVSGQEGEAVGALAFDFDNDGLTDLYVTYLDRGNLLYRNRGDGTFEEVGDKAGVALQDFCTSAIALDYDRDGWPDLYVLVYGRPGVGPNLQANNAAPNHLFHNNRDGTFTDVTKASRTGDTGWGLAAESADLDGDGWPDIYVANDFGNHAYLRNNRDGTFTNLSKKAGILDPGFGMGVAIDDYDGDGRLDLYVSNYSFPWNWFLKDPRYPMPAFPYSLGRPIVWRRLQALSRGSSLFRSLGDGRFERTSDEAGVSDTSWSWGCVFVDADLDGLPDLFVVNGMATGPNDREREIDFWNLMSAEFRKFEKGIPIADFGDDSLWGRPPKRFYRNRDGKHFDELAAVAGLESTANERGVVVLDANGDGAPDLFATGFLQRSSLWINRNPSKAKSLVVTLEGDPRGPGPYRSTRDALGAVVTVEAGGRRRSQVVSAGSSYLSSSSKSLYFGLGDRTAADRVTVRWPSGKVTRRENVPTGRLRLAEASL